MAFSIGPLQVRWYGLMYLVAFVVAWFGIRARTSQPWSLIKREQAEEGRRTRATLLRDFERTTLTPANFCALKGIDPQSLDTLLATARREREERPRDMPPRPGPARGHGRPPAGPERHGRPPRR